MKNYHVRYAPLAQRFEIVRVRAATKKSNFPTVADRKDAHSEVMSAMVEMMHQGFEPGQRVALDFNIGDKRYKMTLQEVSSGIEMTSG